MYLKFDIGGICGSLVNISICENLRDTLITNAWNFKRVQIKFQ